MRWSIELATPADGAELASIYDSDDGFPGDIAVRFGRSADPYASLLAEGDDVVIPLVRDNESGRIIGMGACVLRQAWVNGEPRRVGYLTGLKALPEYRRRVPLIPQVYALLGEQVSADVLYTTIVSDNVLARRMLERRRPSMPEYRTVGQYTTYAFGAHVPRPTHKLADGTIAELLDLVGRPNLAPITAPAGISDQDVRMLCDRNGRIVAGCALWNQQAHKSYVVTRYGGRYERLAQFPVHWLGYPRLPQAGVAANYVSIALLGAHDPRWIQPLLTAVAREQRQRDFLLVGMLDNHPFASSLARLRTVSYSSILYTVHFEHDSAGLDQTPVLLDVGLL